MKQTKYIEEIDEEVSNLLTTGIWLGQNGEVEEAFNTFKKAVKLGKGIEFGKELNDQIKELDQMIRAVETAQ